MTKILTNEERADLEKRKAWLETLLPGPFADKVEYDWVHDQYWKAVARLKDKTVFELNPVGFWHHR